MACCLMAPSHYLNKWLTCHQRWVNAQVHFFIFHWRQLLRVHLHGTQQAARQQNDMLQHYLLHAAFTWQAGCRMWHLHRIHVSAVSEVDVLQRKLLMTAWACAARQFSFKTKLWPLDVRAHSPQHVLWVCATLWKCSCCIPIFLFCGASVLLQSRCLLCPV